ncbi:MAG: SKP1 family protein [Sulfobacillus sp.]
MKLICNDGTELSADAAMMRRFSVTLRNMMEGFPEPVAIESCPISNVSGPVMAKVLEWCIKHDDYPDSSVGDNPELHEWDARYIDPKSIGYDMLFSLILATNYLDIKGLFGLACQAVADIIRPILLDKTIDPAEGIRKEFGIKNEFPARVIQQIAETRKWVCS